MALEILTFVLGEVFPQTEFQIFNSLFLMFLLTIFTVVVLVSSFKLWKHQKFLQGGGEASEQGSRYGWLTVLL